jgi:spermidine synthase
VIGCTAIIGQILLMRALFVVFQGNEISLGIVLAAWLIWTAAGVALAGRVVTRLLQPKVLLAALQAAAGVALPLTILLVRVSRDLWGIVPGEMVGPDSVLVISALTLGTFCLISGGLFAVASRVLTVHVGFTVADATSSVYLWEALGSGAAGVVCSLLLMGQLSSLEIACLVFWLSLVAGTLLLSGGKKGGILALCLTAVLLVLPLSGIVRQWELSSIEALWTGFRVTESRDSKYSNLVVTEAEGKRTVFANGVAVLSVPDRQAAEESVHYALLQHSGPRQVLLIGGGMNGGLVEALKHPPVERVVYLELDAVMLELARRHLGDSWGESLEQDERVEILALDGRLYVKRSDQAFDVIIVNVPDPVTAQLNRYYTTEFFREASRRLLPGGLISFAVTGAENYIGEEQATFLRCINKTLRTVFSEVSILPGPVIHFFASDSGGAQTLDPDVLLRRLKNRGIEAEYVREYYLPFRLSSDRIEDLEAGIRPRDDTRVNRDFSPAAYYFNIMLWTTHFRGLYRSIFSNAAAVSFPGVLGFAILASLIPLAWTFLGAGGPARIALGAQYAVLAMGLTVISLQVILLLGFQAIFGFVYYQLVLLVAAAMLGMGIGGWLSIRQAGSQVRTLLLLQVALALSPLALYGVLRAFAATAGSLSLAGEVLIPVIALGGGLLGGYHFPFASRVYFETRRKNRGGIGRLYALDLLGACFGAMILSTYLIPIFGFFESALVISVLNSAPCLLLLSGLTAKP